MIVKSRQEASFPFPDKNVSPLFALTHNQTENQQQSPQIETLWGPLLLTSRFTLSREISLPVVVSIARPYSTSCSRNQPSVS